jgi:hypothetical protein
MTTPAWWRAVAHILVDRGLFTYVGPIMVRHTSAPQAHRRESSSSSASLQSQHLTPESNLSVTLAYPCLPETNTTESKMEGYEETQREPGTHRQAFFFFFFLSKTNLKRM